MVIFFDVRFAVVIFAYPNLLTNIWQVARYRVDFGPKRLWLVFAVAGLVGTVFGSLLLIWLPPDTLLLILALIVVGYVAFRLMRPDWVLERGFGTKLAGPIGLVAGVFYGAVALSAPISITYLNAMRLPRPEFIATVSAFFLGMGLSQIPMLFGLGLLNSTTHIIGLAGTAAMLASMPLGEAVARRFSEKTFDRLILLMLSLIAFRIFWTLSF